MAKLVLVCGQTGAGKTTHAIAVAKEIGAIRFSIDPWMKLLFEKDLKSFDYEWITERVERCCEQIWEVTEQILKLDGNAVLDLSFRMKAQRTRVYERASALGVAPELHFLDIPADLRRSRIQQRNRERNPAVFSFEVTNFMFDFMESKFEAPDDQELAAGLHIQ